MKRAFVVILLAVSVSASATPASQKEAIEFLQVALPACASNENLKSVIMRCTDGAKSANIKPTGCGNNPNENLSCSSLKSQGTSIFKEAFLNKNVKNAGTKARARAFLVQWVKVDPSVKTKILVV